MAKMITLNETVTEKVKTPQIRVILKTLEDKAGVGNPYPYLDLIKAVDENEEFVSRQGANKVIRFYEKLMVENNLIVLEGTDKPEVLGKPPKKIIKEDGEKAPTERKASRRKKGEAAEGEATEHAHAAE